MGQVFASGPDEQSGSGSSLGAGPASPPAPPSEPPGGASEPPPAGEGHHGEPPREALSPPQRPAPGLLPPVYGRGQRFPGPSQPPPTLPRRPRKPPAKEIQQRGWSALAFGLLSLLGLSAVQDPGHAVYVLALALLIGAVGVWLGASAASRARRGGSYLPRGAVSGIILGAFGLVLSVIMLAGFALLRDELSAYSNCMKGANTVTAQQSCQNQLSQSVRSKVSEIQSGTGR